MNYIKSLPLACLLIPAIFSAVPATAKEENSNGSIRPSKKVAPAELPALAKISFDQALHAALVQWPGNIIKAELEIEDGSLMYSFEIVGTNKKIKEIEIDAGNGKVLNTEDEDNENSEKASK